MELGDKVMPKDQGYPIRLDISEPGKAKNAPRPRTRAGELTAALPGYLAQSLDKTRAGYQEGLAIADAERRKGYADTAIAAGLTLPLVYGARGLAQDIVGDPIAQIVRALGSGSGGELPKSAQQGKGAADKPKQLTTRPKSAASLYDQFNGAAIRAIAAQQGGVSLNQLAKLAPTVPAPAKPLSIEDVARSQVLEGINHQYQTAISAADAAGDYDEVARLYAERDPRLIALFDTTASLLAQAENNKD